nr:Chain C, Peptide from Nuclear receptor coactivator 2 [Homo sapiens]5IAW_D Chain D, Peptide from Nuclear receptor coactivator 2 [Homo sapiens]5Y1J_U Chain U, Peptide from Nuclear receptor coactivator 2 [Homo sapiens]
NALLRYLLDK